MQRIGRCVRKKDTNQPSFIYVPLEEYNQEELEAIDEMDLDNDKKNLEKVVKALRTKF